MYEKMNSHNYSLPNMSSLLPSSCLYPEYQDSFNERMTDPPEELDENLCDFDDLEVFQDHILMGERLRKSLYAGGFEDLKDFPDHPPIALTGLALELFSKAVPNYGLDILDMDTVSATSEATRVPPCAMIIAMIYLERLQLQKSEYLETVSPPGLFVVTMLVASKFLFEDEDMVSNQMWAEALNFDIKELNDLEKDFLSAIDWKVFVNHSEYLKYLSSIEKLIALKQSSFRNWLSYTDISVMMQDPNFSNRWKNLIKNFVKATLLWTLGYAATALALYYSSMSINKVISKTSVCKDLVSDRHTELNHHFHHMADVENYLVMDTSDQDIAIALEMSEQIQQDIQNKNTNCYRCTTLLGSNSPYNERLSANTYSNYNFGTFFNDNISGNYSRTNNTLNDSSSWIRIKNKSCIPVLVR